MRLRPPPGPLSAEIGLHRAGNASRTLIRAPRALDPLHPYLVSRIAFSKCLARLGSLLLAPGLALILSACVGSSSAGPNIPTIPPARTYKLAGLEPTKNVPPGRQTNLSFTLEQPNGQPLTDYRTGPGPHTGVHVILVRDDLSTIIHNHPPVGPSGRIDDPITFQVPGKYRLVVDAYPNTTGPQRNFQLFGKIDVAGNAHNKPLPPFNPTVDVDGYRFHIEGAPKLKAIQAAFLKLTVTDPDGKPARFEPWYGALAHAIFFRSGSLDYFHTHVCAPGATGCTSLLGGASVSGSSATPGKMRVGVLLPVSGTWRLFLQCRVDGRTLTAPFTLDVK